MLKTLTRFALTLLAALLLTHYVQAQQLQKNDTDDVLLFRTGEYPVPANLNEFLSDFKTQPRQEHVLYRIIQFEEIPSFVKSEMLAKEGITLLGYIPEMAWYARIAANANVDVLSDYKAKAVIEIGEILKLAPELYFENYPAHALRPDHRIELNIHYFMPEVREALAEQLAAHDVSFVAPGFSPDYFVASAPIAAIRILALIPEVKFIEAVNPPGEPENNSGITLHRSSALINNFPFGRHYDGTGINVMLQDDGIIGPHIDYQGRIGNQYITHNSGNHGDHCAGTIMGAGNLDPKGRGMAPGATIYVYGAGGYQGFSNIGSHYNNPGIRITSTSYSDGCNAGYTGLTRTMDQQSRLYPGLIHVFSAGNAGTDNCAYGAGPGWGNITGGHKAAKNVIAVGNVSLTDALSSSSSRGPAHDGRIKPEVVAKGTSVYSTIDPNTYQLASGTSMACPGVSGTLAQLYQAYQILNNGNSPNGGLMKAILMNTADDLGNPGPDFRFGFGRINALRAAQAIEDQRYDSAVVEQGGFASHFIDVPENMRELRVMLYWTDWEASTGVSKALVNNLNLEVYDPDGVVFLPWVLNHYPHPDSLNARPTRKTDNLNNVEQVTLANPTPGTYQISVSAPLVPQGPQKYFVTWEIINNDIVLTHPYGGEAFVPGDKELIRWDSPDFESDFVIEFTTDNGSSWQLLATAIPGSQRYYEWTVPLAATGHGYIRIRQNGQTAFNVSAFSIFAVPQNLSIEWVCDSLFRVKWNKVYGAPAYLVSKLGEKYMDVVGLTAENTLIIAGDSSVSDYVSVQAVAGNALPGPRAKAILRQAGIQNCRELDLELDEILSANWSHYHLAALGSGDFPVKVRIKNAGILTVKDFSVAYTVNDGLPVFENVSFDLGRNGSYLHHFSSGFTIADTGNYYLKVWVIHPEDTFQANDTIVRRIRVVNDEPVAYLLSYSQNFDAFTRCATHPACELVVCPLTEGWTNLTNNEHDKIDWRTFGGPTPTTLTGPPFDHTTGTSVGNYLFLRASVVCFNREAILISPCFDLSSTNNAGLSFWYHMYGIHSGRIHLDAFMNGEIFYDIIPPIIGEQGNEWKQALVMLDDFVGNNVVFRFRGVTGPGQLGDIAIDDFEIFSVTGTQQLSAGAMNVSVFPNPNSGLFTLQIKDSKPGDVHLHITDIMGKAVYDSQIQSSGMPVTHQIDLGGLPSGIYFLLVRTSDGLSQKKIVKQ